MKLGTEATETELLCGPHPGVEKELARLRYENKILRQERDLLTLGMPAGYEVAGFQVQTGSGAKLDRAEQKKVMALAQARQIDAVRVTELSRWGRSTMDMLHTLRELEARHVSLIAMSGSADAVICRTGAATAFGQLSGSLLTDPPPTSFELGGAASAI